MRRILLATASLVAFAGAAAAQDLDSSGLEGGVAFGGSTVFGYNDEIEDGFFIESSLAPSLTTQLDGGLEVGVLFGFDIQDSDEDDFGDDDDDFASDFLLYIRADGAALNFGDALFAAELQWSEDNGPGPVGDMASDDFSEQGDEIVLRGDATIGNIDASVSYVIADADGDSADDVDQLSLGASGTFGMFSFSMGYQDESDSIDRGTISAADLDPAGDGFVGDGDGDATIFDERVALANGVGINSDINGDGDFGDRFQVGDEDASPLYDGEYNNDDDDDFDSDEVFGISAGATFGGADLELGYSTNLTEETDSLGVQASYPFGPVTLSANYIFESADDPAGNDEDTYRLQADYTNGPFTGFVFYEDEQGDEDTGVEATYDIGNGLSLNAGYSDDEDGFVAATYTLGDGSILQASYAEFDEAGAADYKEGTTVLVSFDF